MGLIAKLKELFSAKAYIIHAMEKMDREQERYAQMTHDELLALSDEELVSAILYRIDCKIKERLGENQSERARIDCLNETERTVYVISCLNDMIETDGLCYFLCDGGVDLAPFVSQALYDIGAAEHGELFDTFLKDNALDVNRLSEFKHNGPKSSLYASYPFGKFDAAYAKLPDMEPLLANYIRLHSEAL